MLRRARHGAWIVGALLAFAPAAVPRAQQTPAPAPAEAAAPAPPPVVAIPLAEIVANAEETKGILKQIEDRTAPDAAETKVETELPELALTLQDSGNLAQTMLSSTRTLEELFDLEVQWGGHADTLTGWRRGLTRRAVAIETELEHLNTLEKRWELTIAAASEAAIPGATRERANETLAAVRAGEKAAKKRRSHVLTLQNEVAQQELVVSGVLELVGTRRSEMRSRLFQRDGAPLWSADAYAPDLSKGGPVERMRVSFETKRAALSTYLRSETDELAAIVLTFLVIWVAVSLMRPRVVGAADQDPSMHAPVRVFTRPISSALLISMFGALYLSARAPAIVREIELLIVLAPMLRVLPRELQGGLRPGILALAGLFAVGTLREMLAGAPMVERLMTLAETFAGIALFVWVLRPSNLVHLTEVGRFGPMVAPIARVAVVLLSLSALGNVVGFVSGSRMLMRGTMSSAYAGVAIYGVARIAGGLVTGIVNGPVGRVLNGVRNHTALVRDRLLRGVYWLAVAAWVYAVLMVFSLQDEVLGGLRSALRAKWELGTAKFGPADLVAFVVTLWVAATISRFLRFVLDEDVLPRIALPRGVPNAIATGVHYLVLFAGFLLAIAAAGIDLSKFTLLAGALGVGIGFGMQNVVNNFVSGLILLFERPVQMGDSIEVGPNRGEVRRIGIRSSTMRTFDGAEVIVPNGNLISETVVNWTLTDRQCRVDVRVGVEYGNDPEKVMALLIATARANAEVLSIPDPVALFMAFGPSAMEFELRFWCRYEIATRVKSEVNVAVLQALNGAGIGIPFPRQDLHLKVEGPLAAALSPARPPEDTGSD